jgi:CheY-like chemotaxis protein
MMTVEAPRQTILKVDHSRALLDRWRDWLVDGGYHVIRARSFKDGVRLARRVHPNVIIVMDDPKNDLDAIEWLELQHADADPVLAMTPLLIIADARQNDEVRLQELPDRVRVVVRPLSPDTLIHAVRHLISAWS